MLREDLARAYDPGPNKRIARIFDCLSKPGVQAIIIFRFGHWLLTRSRWIKMFLKLPYYYLERRIRSKWGIHIERKAHIGEGFLIHHYGGIFIGGDSFIGKQFTISHDTVVGTAGEGRRRGWPTIGDNVVIAPGANVSGKLRIGNNVKIGPNAVVNHDIPDNALVYVRSMQVVTFPNLYGKSQDPQPIGKP